MAKRKKLKNIQINNQELTPTTIGYLDYKQKGPFLLIFIFAVLFAALYYMPELTEYFSGTKVPNDGNPYGNVVDNNGEVFALKDELKITVKNIEFSKIIIENEKISIYAENTKNSSASLKDYYIELYDQDENVLERVDLSNESLSNLGKRTYSYDIKYQNEIAKISISIIAIEQYPIIKLRTENDIQVLNCTYDKKNYVYEFVEEKLKKATFKVNLVKADFSNEMQYQTEYQKYRDMATNNLYKGIGAFFTDLEGGFSLSREIDLVQANPEDIDDELYYSLDASANEVAFQNSLKKFKCY